MTMTDQKQVILFLQGRIRLFSGARRVLLTPLLLNLTLRYKVQAVINHSQRKIQDVLKKNTALNLFTSPTCSNILDRV